jgi:spore maturation protein CgeB
VSRIVFLGLSITSSWGNGHATNYRALVRELARRGHDVLFLERDMPWYAAHRDLPVPPWGRTELYTSLGDLHERFEDELRAADLVVVGSYVPEGVAVAEWATSTADGATAFYDIDTPVTVAKLEAGDEEYLSRALVPRFDAYLSFTGGPLLEHLEGRFGARNARAFYCLVDADAYRPLEVAERWALGYLGTYSTDRQPALDELLGEPARRLPDERFVVGGPGYPATVDWPANVERIDHLPPSEHAAFYAGQRLTLNVTRAEMRRWGWSPSVRLFEAAACGVPIVSDLWEGLDALFVPEREILVASSAGEVLELLRDLPGSRLRDIAAAARARVLAEHTAERRIDELEAHLPVLRSSAAAA